MYHRVSPFQSDRLTVPVKNIRDQFSFLAEHDYRVISLPHFLDALSGKATLPEKCCMLTFDDGHLSHYEYVYPLLLEYNFNAVFFIIGNSLNNGVVRDHTDQNMSVDQLRSLSPSVVQLGLHSYSHLSFANCNLATIENDLTLNKMAAVNSGCIFYNVLAYPYGARPQSADCFRRLKRWMKHHEIEAAFRIGNKPCVPGHSDPYELKRVDISGTDTLKDFTIKLKKGKLKPF
jgi:peptidoglycan/xylan/chitin deacetylase (PgdA/CDA1 family)